MRFKYYPEHLDFLRWNYPSMMIPELTEAFNAWFGLEKTPGQIKAALGNHKILCDRTGRFESGHESWNKGTKGLTSANKTSFKKGHSQTEIKPIGHERICSKDGYVLIKVNERNPHTGAPTRYLAKHRVVWEKENGPIPSGHAIKFLDDDKTNCDIDNLILLTRAELCYLNKNGYNELPDELKPSFRALARLISATHAADRQGARP